MQCASSMKHAIMEVVTDKVNQYTHATHPIRRKVVLLNFRCGITAENDERCR